MENRNLSQNEIDALFEAKDEGKEALSELLTQTVDEVGSFKEYDFVQPDKFNLDNTNSLKQIAKLLGRNLSQTLTAKLRLSSSLSIELNKENPIEQLPYTAEYTEKMPKDRFVFVVIDLTLKGLGKIILQMDLAMAMALHRKSMGAPTVELNEERKPLTFLEKKGLEKWLTEYVIPNLEESFESVVKTEMKVHNIDMDPQQIKITTSNDMVALVMYDVWFENNPSVQTTMFLCIPYLSIEPIIEKLTTENVHEFKMKDEDKQRQVMLRKNVELIQKNIDIELGKTRLHLKELLSLELGDVLRLDKEVGEEMVGYIGGKAKFVCLPGRIGNKIAVKVTGFAKKGGENLE